MQSSQENNCAGVSIKLLAEQPHLYLKKHWDRSSLWISQNFQSTFFTEPLCMTASAFWVISCNFLINKAFWRFSCILGTLAANHLAITIRKSSSITVTISSMSLPLRSFSLVESILKDLSCQRVTTPLQNSVKSERLCRLHFFLWFK